MLMPSFARSSRRRIILCIILGSCILLSLIHRFVVVAASCRELRAHVAVLEQRREQLAFELKRTHELFCMLQEEYEQLKMSSPVATPQQAHELSLASAFTPDKLKVRPAAVGQKRGVRRRTLAAPRSGSVA